jgi:hypothetical protein
MGAMIAGVWRGRGRFAQPRPRLGRALLWFGRVYFASMVVRYAVTMAVRPQWRWFGHTIPMLFHCVLATYVMVYSTVLAVSAREPGAQSDDPSVIPDPDPGIARSTPPPAAP